MDGMEIICCTLKAQKNPRTIVVLGFCGAGGGTRTHTPSLAADFESATSTNSITPAGVFAKRSAPLRFWGQPLIHSRRQERTEERTEARFDWLLKIPKNI